MQTEQPEAIAADLSFRDAVGVLRRQRPLVLATLLAFALLAAAFSLWQKPKYRSVSQVLVENAPGFVNMSDPMTAMSTQESTYSVPTQVEVLQSNEVLDDALQRLGIPIPQSQEDMDRLPKVKVEEEEETNVIQVSVDASTPELARKLAATLPYEYYNYIRGKQSYAVTEGLNFVAYRTGEETKALKAATFALSEFKRKNKVVDSPSELQARLVQSNQSDADRAAARADAKAAQAQLDAAIKARAALQPMRDVPSSETNAGLIEQAKLQLEQYQQQRKQLLVDYREDSMPVRKADAQIKSQEAYIASLSRDVKSHVKTRNPDIPIYDQRVAEAKEALRAAEAKAAAVASQAASKSSRLEALPPVAREEQELERQVQVHQANLQQLAEMGAQLQLRNNALKSPVSNITQESKPGVLDVNAASLPVQVAPRWGLNMAVGVLLGLLVGCFLALARDTTQDKVNSERDVRWASELDILARLPLIPGRVGSLIWSSGDRLALDRFRLLRSNLALAAEAGNGAIVRAEEDDEDGIRDAARGTRAESSNGNGGFKPSLLLPYSSPALTSIMVTSTFQGEGKSTVAANLATAMAMDKRQVILVDANLRAPSVHKSFNLESVPGLTEVLHGGASLEEALQDTAVEGLRVLTCGELPLNPSGVLASAEMLELHERLRSIADVVIYDCVSSYALADAQALAAIVGSVVFVTQLGVPRKDDMREALTSLMMTKAKVLGVVLNKERKTRVVLS
jgi:capsular exopolysaccharide synthesis family protein